VKLCHINHSGLVFLDTVYMTLLPCGSISAQSSLDLSTHRPVDLVQVQFIRFFA